MRAMPFFAAAIMLAASDGPVVADCQCRAEGRVFEQGQTTCIAYPDGKKLVRCDMVLNNSSWKRVQDGCPEADAGALPAPAALRAPGLQSRATHTH